MQVSLNHFTCVHAAAAIRRAGELHPHRHPLLRASLVWLTDLPEPDRWALGLAASWIPCDRTAVRVSVSPRTGIVPWHLWALWHRVPAGLVQAVEDGGRPDRWWVCELPVPVATVTESGHAAADAVSTP